jgi:radical SAM protein with 4Fe4S-binding SPASM domain
MDLRSPCGAGIGQLAYNYDGRVYTCDEARMIGAMGDDIFCIGNVGRDHYADLIGHGGVRTLAVASCLDGLPECTDCAYAPYCGVCPVYSYATAGDIFPHAPSCARCKIQKGILDMLFARLARGGEEMTQLFLRWTVDRDRSPVYRKRD